MADARRGGTEIAEVITELLQAVAQSGEVYLLQL